MTGPKLTDAFEPLAMELAERILAAKGERTLDDDDMVNLSTVSLAQSLKRIADAAELIASCVQKGGGDPPEFTTYNRGNPQ